MATVGHVQGSATFSNMTDCPTVWKVIGRREVRGCRWLGATIIIVEAD